MKVRIRVDPSFIRGLKSLPPDRREKADAALRKFQTSPDLPGLRFRPLQGRPQYYLINPNRGDRIILHKEADDL